MNHHHFLTKQSAGQAACSAALLVCAAVAQTSAQAQTSVSIYGIIDQGITKANGGTTPGALLPGRAAPDVWTVKAGNTSRLGFRGREDLGSGSYARFQFEHRFAADTGASSNANVFWLGRSVVAIGSDSYGEIYAGREYSAAYWVPLFADPTAWSYVSQLGAPYTYAGYTGVPSSVEASNLRWANSLGYKSPNLSGLSFEIATALGEGLRKRDTSGNIQYKKGAVWLGAAFDRLDSKNNLSILAGGYDFGVVFPTFTISRTKGGVNGDANAFSLSVRVPVSYGRIYASYGSLRPATNLDSAMLGAGTEYNLSKRSLLYFNLGSAKRDNATRTSAFDAGLKHTF